MSLFLAGPVLAQGASEEGAEETDTESETAAEESDAAAAEAAEQEENAEQGQAPAAADTVPGSPIGLERLPASGYPAPRVRGIYGGSLWLNMHGLQWPYMPQVGTEPATRIGFSGSVWVDTSYGKVDSGLPMIAPNVKEWRQQSRLVLRVTPTYNAGDNWFVQGQGELVLNGAAPARTEEFLVADDIFVRVGRWNQFDVTFGRIQGWEIYHLGMGLDLNTVERFGARTEGPAPVDLYGLTFFWDRPNGPGRIAAHYYPNDFLRFELLGQIGSSGSNDLAARPVGILDLGVVKVKLGAEYGKETPRQQAADRKDYIERRGVAGSVQLVLDPHLEAGIAGGHALVDRFNNQGVLDAGASFTITSYGAFANARVVGPLILGAGINYTEDHNLKVDATGQLNDIRTHLQIFGAAQYALWDQLFAKLVIAHADALFDPQSNPPPVASYRNKALSARLRMLYLF